MQKAWTWLNTNSGGVTALVLLAQAIFLAGALIVAWYAFSVSVEALNEGNRIAWRTFLDQKSSDFGKQLIEKDALHCI